MPLLAYILTLPILAGLDLLWAGVLMKGFYHDRIGYLFSSSLHWPALVVLYLFFAFALYYFAILPGYSARMLSKAILNAALLGALAYATYDLTNMATLSPWPLSVTALDILWGA